MWMFSCLRRKQRPASGCPWHCRTVAVTAVACLFAPGSHVHVYGMPAVWTGSPGVQENTPRLPDQPAFRRVLRRRALRPSAVMAGLAGAGLAGASQTPHGPASGHRKKRRGRANTGPETVPEGSSSGATRPLPPLSLSLAVPVARQQAGGAGTGSRHPSPAASPRSGHGTGASAGAGPGAGARGQVLGVWASSATSAASSPLAASQRAVRLSPVRPAPAMAAVPGVRVRPWAFLAVLVSAGAAPRVCFLAEVVVRCRNVACASMSVHGCAWAPLPLASFLVPRSRHSRWCGQGWGQRCGRQSTAHRPCRAAGFAAAAAAAGAARRRVGAPCRTQRGEAGSGRGWGHGAGAVPAPRLHPDTGAAAQRERPRRGGAGGAERGSPSPLPVPVTGRAPRGLPLHLPSATAPATAAAAAAATAAAARA